MQIKYKIWKIIINIISYKYIIIIKSTNKKRKCKIKLKININKNEILTTKRLNIKD